MKEIKELLQEATKVSEELKITRQEALRLINVYELTCIHDHIDKIIFGIFQAHAIKKQEE